MNRTIGRKIALRINGKNDEINECFYDQNVDELSKLLNGFAGHHDFSLPTKVEKCQKEEMHPREVRALIICILSGSL